MDAETRRQPSATSQSHLKHHCFCRGDPASCDCSRRDCRLSRRRQARSIVQLPDSNCGHAAIVDGAHGVIAYGGLATGIIAVGGVSAGVISFGGISVGFLSLGGLSVGWLTLGAVAVGWRAIGAVAVGQAALGSLVIGRWAYAGPGVALGRDESSGGKQKESLIG